MIRHRTTIDMHGGTRTMRKILHLLWMGVLMLFVCTEGYALENHISVSNEELKVHIESVVSATNQVNTDKTPNVEINENTASANTEVSTNSTQTNINI